MSSTYLEWYNIEWVGHEVIVPSTLVYSGSMKERFEEKDGHTESYGAGSKAGIIGQADRL